MPFRANGSTWQSCRSNDSSRSVPYVQRSHHPPHRGPLRPRVGAARLAGESGLAVLHGLRRVQPAAVLIHELLSARAVSRTIRPVRLRPAAPADPPDVDPGVAGPETGVADDQVPATRVRSAR